MKNTILYTLLLSSPVLISGKILSMELINKNRGEVSRSGGYVDNNLWHPLPSTQTKTDDFGNIFQLDVSGNFQFTSSKGDAFTYDATTKITNGTYASGINILYNDAGWLNTTNPATG